MSKGNKDSMDKDSSGSLHPEAIKSQSTQGNRGQIRPRANSSKGNRELIHSNGNRGAIVLRLISGRLTNEEQLIEETIGFG